MCGACRYPWMLTNDALLKKRQQESQTRMAQATGGHSDHLMLVRLYNEWESLTHADQVRFAEENGIRVSTMRSMSNLRGLLTRELSMRGLLGDGNRLVQQAASAYDCHLVRHVLVRSPLHQRPSVCHRISK